MILTDILKEPILITGLLTVSTIIFLLYIINAAGIPMKLNIQSLRMHFFFIKLDQYLLPAFLFLVIGWALPVIYTISITGFHYVAVVVFLIALLMKTLFFPGIFKPINNPEYISVNEAETTLKDYLEADDVIGVVHGDIARAYPIEPLNMAHILNGSIGDLKISVTYCGLCNSTHVYNRVVNGTELKFRATANVYHSNLIMKDNTGNLYIQLTGECVRGKNKGVMLEKIHSIQTSWPNWKRLHPNTQVLSYRHRGKLAFSYKWFSKASNMVRKTDFILFPAGKTSDQFSPKTPIMGVIVNGNAMAIPVDLFEKGVSLNTQLGDKPLYLYLDHETGLFGAFIRPEDVEIELKPVDNSVELVAGKNRWTASGKAIQADTDLKTAKYTYPMFWFAWYGNYPDTVIKTP